MALVMTRLNQHSLKRALACAAAGITLAACSSLPSINPLNWFGSGTPAERPTPLTEIKPTITLERVWAASIGAGAEFVFSPAVYEGSVYAANARGELAAFDLTTGAQKWRAQADRQGLSAGVGAGPGTVVVGTVKGAVIAYDLSGKEKWRSSVTSEVLAAPLVDQAYVYVRTGDNRITALNAADGKRVWVYQRSAPALVLRNPAGMVLERGSLFAGFPGGKLIALNLSNGTVRWEGTVAQPKGTTELERIADITSSPVVSGREVCAVAFQGRVACFEISNGQPVWNREVSSVSGMAADPRYVFVADDRSSFIGLARGTGSSLWKQDRLLHRNLSSPLSAGRAAITGDYQGILHLISREDGNLIGRQATDGSAIVAPMVPFALGSKDGFVVQTKGGGLFAFAL
jgi:outer membrane protein assembly factor BamB